MRLRSLIELANASRLSRTFPISLLTQRMRKAVRKRRAIDLRKERDAAVQAHGLVDPEDLLTFLRENGVADAPLVFVQSSFNDLFTFKGTPARLLKLLRDLVGQQHSLFMPAYTSYRHALDSEVFDPERTPTHTGIVNELFRRSDGVQRSIHPRHSICGSGPLAEQVLSGHDHCGLPDGPNSPFDRMRLVEGAMAVTLGLPAGHLSFLHWIEDIEPAKFPWSVHDKQPSYRLVRFPGGDVRQVADFPVRARVACRLDVERVAAQLQPPAMRFTHYRGLAVGLYSLDALSKKLIQLRDAGIVHYS